jgi:hypothetical protein
VFHQGDLRAAIMHAALRPVAASGLKHFGLRETASAKPRRSGSAELPGT